MSKDEPGRLGWGGQYASEAIKKEDVRNRFLQKLQEIAPEVSKNLYDAVIPEYREYFVERWKFWLEHRFDASIDWESLPEPIQKPVLAWAQEFNLRADWMLETVTNSLYWWATQTREPWDRSYLPSDSKQVPPRVWRPPMSFHQIPVNPHDFTISLPAPDLMRVTKVKARELMMAEIKYQVDVYLDRIVNAFTQADTWNKELPQRRLDTHLTWFIEYQVLGLTESEVAQRHYKEPTSIRNVLTALAKDLDLSKATKAPGGPGKRRNRR